MTTPTTAPKIHADMVAQFGETVTDVMARDERVVTLLGNVTTGYFARAFAEMPERVYDVGILEQTMNSLAAGLALEGLIPVVHTIAPFLIERAYEQIKLDFVYQGLGGNFIGKGASYDYSEYGMTHHGPGDVRALLTLPRMQVVVPGTPSEFDALFRAAYANGEPTYYRLGLARNAEGRDVRFGKAEVVRRGTRATVLAVGPMLDRTLAAVAGLDVSVLYYTTLAPFDAETLRAVVREASAERVVVVEPSYEGGLTDAAVQALAPAPVRVEAIGVPHRVITEYGTPAEHDAALGLTAEGIAARVRALLGE